MHAERDLCDLTQLPIRNIMLPSATGAEVQTFGHRPWHRKNIIDESYLQKKQWIVTFL